jgi:ABC-2 type transport system permease protein
MNRIWSLAQKDLLLTRRDRMVALFTVIMPLAFTVFFGLLFGGNNTSKFPLAIIDQDKSGSAHTELVRLLRSSKVVTLKTMTASKAESGVRDATIAAAVIIPNGFTAALDAGKPAQLTLISESASTGGMSAVQAVKAAADRVADERLAARVSVQASGILLKGPSNAAQSIALAEVQRQFASPVLSVKVSDSGSASGEVPTGFVLSSPGMLVNFMLFSVLSAGIALIVERRSGTLRRLRTTQARGSQLIAGKIAGMVVVTLIQQVVLLGVAQVAFGVNYLRGPAALVILMVSLSLLASCLGLMLATLFKGEQALVSTTVILSMLLAATGGAWFPLEITGAGFSAVGHVLPVAWILDAFRGIVLRGYGIANVLPAAGIALGYAMVFFGVAVWRFRFED